MECRTPSSERPGAEEGFTLAGLLVLLTIISIVVAATVPEQWSKVMQRERDKQTIFMMKQAARAIFKWQQKNGSPPGSLDQLKDAKQPRLLRLVGEDFPMPLTGKEDDWILVPQNAIDQTPPAVPPGQPPPAVNLPPPSKLRKELSPADYEGPFVAIRPNMEGKSFLSLNGAEDYSEWVYTAQDASNETQMRIAALNVK